MTRPPRRAAAGETALWRLSPVTRGCANRSRTVSQSSSFARLFTPAAVAIFGTKNAVFRAIGTLHVSALLDPLGAPQEGRGPN
jgi:hypothetical protein